ncbi:MAG: uroporphyrinogen decarboxylase family protein [Bacteroidota bacterium]
MTPKLRVKAAMDLQVPDRVPLMCQLSIGHMLQQLRVSPSEFWHEPQVFAEGLIRLREIYDFDGILVSLHGHDRRWKDTILERKPAPEGGEEIRWKNGSRTVYPVDDLPRHYATGDQKKPSFENFRLSDLPPTLSYIPVSQGLYFPIDPAHKFDVFHILCQKVGATHSIHGEVTSPFDYFLDFFGHQDALMYLIDDSDKAKRVLDHFTTLIEQLAVEMCETGIDAIKLSSPFAGSGFISSGFYSEFITPFEGRIARAVRAKGVHFYTHTCGAIGDRLELMFDAGVSGIECLDPPPLGDVELADAKQRTRGRGFIKGNIDSVNKLLFGSEQEILDDARTRLEVGKQGGGFILSTACSVAPHVTRSKLLLLREAAERWG